MPELKSFGTKVDADLVRRFNDRLPRRYSLRTWLETMMQRTIDMSDAELESLLTDGEEE